MSRIVLRLGSFLLALCCVLVASFDAASAGRLEEIRARGEVVFAVRDAITPFGFIEESSGRLVGFDLDLARLIAKALGVRPAFRPAAREIDLVRMTGAQLVDLGVGAPVRMFEGSHDADASAPYHFEEQRLIVRTGSTIRKPAETAGKRVALVRHSAAERLLKQKAPRAEVVHVNSTAQALMTVKRGEAEAAVGDAVSLAGLLTVEDRPGDWMLAPEPIGAEPIGLALPKNDPKFKDVIDKILVRLTSGGELDATLRRWIGPDTKYRLLSKPGSDALPAPVEPPSGP